MSKRIFILVVSLFLPVLILSNIVNAMPNPALIYCEHQGYEARENRCYFGNNNSCHLRGFYNGSCGTKYQREIPCRQEGEMVFPEFESCCPGLKASAQTSLFGGVKPGAMNCYPKYQVYIRENTLTIILIIALIIILTGYFIWKNIL